MTNFTYETDANSQFSQIRNIFCVGRNYRDHATELGNAIPTEPMIFAKSTHALVPAKDRLVLPNGRTDIHHELEIVLYIGRSLEAGRTASDVVTKIALGLDLTDRTAQSRLKDKGHPWEYAKSFVGSAVVTDFYTFDSFQSVEECTFSLSIDGHDVQVGYPRDMVFNFDKLVSYVHEHYGLTEGDILFTGTPAGVSALQNGQQCVMRMNGDDWGSFTVESQSSTGKES